MTDQCTHCSYKGNLTACKAAECSKHEDWYPMQLQKELDELKASIPKIKADAIREAANNAKGDYLVSEAQPAYRCAT